MLDHGIPLMSSSTRGGAKLGDGLSVDGSGVLSAASYFTNVTEGSDTYTVLVIG